MVFPDIIEKGKYQAIFVLLIIGIISLALIIYDQMQGKERIPCIQGLESKLPVWPISNSGHWKLGRFKNVELGPGKDYIKLKDGKRSGTWLSPTKNWENRVDYYYAFVDSEVTAGKIILNFNVSEDNFRSSEDVISKSLEGGKEKVNLCGLENSTSMKVKVQIKSRNENKELTTLHGMWIYFRPIKNTSGSNYSEPKNDFIEP